MFEGYTRYVTCETYDPKMRMYKIKSLQCEVD